MEFFDISKEDKKDNFVLYSFHIDQYDFWIFLYHKMQFKDTENIDHYSYITNDLDILQFETWKSNSIKTHWKIGENNERRHKITHET